MILFNGQYYDNYFDVPAYSNSTLSWIKREWNQVKMNPEKLRLGTKIDEQLFSGEEGDDETRRIIEVCRNDSNFAHFVQHPDFTAQYEWYGEFMGLPWKCKLDGFIPNFMRLEFKSCQVNSHPQFLQLIDRLDYDRQDYVYAQCTGIDRGLLYGATKHKLPKTFSQYTSAGDKTMDSGKRKTEYLIEILKTMI